MIEFIFSLVGFCFEVLCYGTIAVIPGFMAAYFITEDKNPRGVWGVIIFTGIICSSIIHRGSQ